MSKANSMGFEEIRSHMKKEVRNHRNGVGPTTRYSTNRLNGLVNAAEANFGKGAARELQREMLSKKR